MMPLVIKIQLQTQSAHQFTSDDCQDQLLPDKCETNQPSVLRPSAHFSYRGSACKQNIDSTPIGRNIHTAQRNLLCDVGVLSLTWLSLIFVSLVKGGHGASSVVGIECGRFVSYSHDTFEMCLCIYAAIHTGEPLYPCLSFSAASQHTLPKEF